MKTKRDGTTKALATAPVQNRVGCGASRAPSSRALCDALRGRCVVRMSRASRLAVAALFVAACGGDIAPGGESGDAGLSSGAWFGDEGGSRTAVGSSSGTAGGSGAGSTGGNSAGTPGSGPPVSGQGATTPVEAGAGSAPPTSVADAATVFPPGDAAVVRCNNAGPGGGAGGGAGGGGVGEPASCSAFASETCSGVSYFVSCACPQGTCACQGPSSTFVAFAGCPACPTSPEQMFAACGFPQ
jgi:hypothetical protein